MTPVAGTEFTVKNLPTGKEFEFRVVPVNAAGPGEPSEPTALVKVQNPVSKCGPAKVIHWISMSPSPLGTVSLNVLTS